MKSRTLGTPPIRIDVHYDMIRYEDMPVHYHLERCEDHDRWFIFRCDGVDEGECGVFGGRGDLCEILEIEGIKSNPVL